MIERNLSSFEGATGRLNVVTGVEDFLVVVLGGAAPGSFLGYLFSLRPYARQ
jgi:NhaP-type Na+/H+ or K+/H+ antiporter